MLKSVTAFFNGFFRTKKEITTTIKRRRYYFDPADNETPTTNR